MDSIKTIAELDHAKVHNPGLVKELFSQVTILPDLERYLLWLSEEQVPTKVVTMLERYKERSLGIHPSSACKKGVCLLRLYYECTNEIPPMRAYDAEMQRTWDIGTLLHCTYQTHLKAMYGTQFRAEVPLEIPHLRVKSRTDGVFSFTRLKIVWEAKSIKEGGNFGWEKVQKKPMDDNTRQAHFYMKAEDAPFGIVFYMNKNAGKLMEHPVMFDSELWAELEETIQPATHAAFDGGPKPEGTAGYHCRWCDYNHACPKVRKEKTHAKGIKRPWGQRR